MNYYIIKYFEGFANKRCLVIAWDEKDAKSLFVASHPKLRDYNVRSIRETSSRVYSLENG